MDIEKNDMLKCEIALKLYVIEWCAEVKIEFVKKMNYIEWTASSTFTVNCISVYKKKHFQV